MRSGLRGLAGPSGLFILMLCLYSAISLRHLTVTPPVYEDEPAQASTAWKLAREGVFASDVFAGYGGIEHHDYRRMPLYPMSLALLFRLAGTGLFQARVESVLLGGLVLVLTFALALRLSGDPRTGILAASFLLLVRLTGTTPYQATGILLLDVSRIARPDLLVPVMGLAALHAYLTARGKDRSVWYLTAGVLCGLAGLGHLYGLFWLPVLLLLLIWDQDFMWRECAAKSAWILGGCAIPWLPYAVYVWSGWGDWRAQMLEYGGRFGLLDPRWYLRNLLEEPRRYGPGLGPPAPSWLLRAGFFATAAALPWAAGTLMRRSRRDPSARALIVPLVMLPALFALLIRLKLANYLVTIYPVLAISLSLWAVRLWDKTRGMHPAAVWRVAMLAAALAVVAEGGSRISALEEQARATTPYYNFIGRVRLNVPEGAGVLGLHRYWFGMEDHPYRSFVVPIWWADPSRTSPPLPLADGLQRIGPDVVLVDGAMRSYFQSQAARDAGYSEAFDKWLSRRQAYLVGSVVDPAYGRLDIFRLTR